VKPEANEWTANAIVHRTFKGAFALGARQILVQGLNLLGAVVLARILDPVEFGYFAVFTFILGFLTIFGGMGLGASLVRETEEPSSLDYAVVFAVQQLFVAGMGVLLWVVAPILAERVGDANESERGLEFGKIAAIEVLQAVAFNAIAVGLAYNDVGVFSFAWALLARSAIGAVAANLASPWIPRFAWDWPRAKRHLTFSLAFQGSMILSIVKDSISPVFVGLLLGAAEVGYVRWAELVAVYPLIALMVLQRVYLPAFTRMRAFPDRLGPFVENVVLATNAFVAPLAVLTLALIEPLTRVVFGPQWLPAIPVFVLLWSANVFVPTLTPVIGLLNSFGRSNVTFVFMAMVTAATWLLGVPSIALWGIVGFGVANLLVQLTAVGLFRVAQKQVRFRIVAVALRPWLVAGGIGLLVALVSSELTPTSVVALVAYFAAALVAYIVVLMIVYPRQARRFWSLLRAPS
jgi:O-antigen/teichoic acid export membrane protein